MAKMRSSVGFTRIMFMNHFSCKTRTCVLNRVPVDEIIIWLTAKTIIHTCCEVYFSVYVIGRLPETLSAFRFNRGTFAQWKNTYEEFLKIYILCAAIKKGECHASHEKKLCLISIRYLVDWILCSASVNLKTNFDRNCFLFPSGLSQAVREKERKLLIHSWKVVKKRILMTDRSRNADRWSDGDPDVS